MGLTQKILGFVSALVVALVGIIAPMATIRSQFCTARLA